MRTLDESRKRWQITLDSATDLTSLKLHVVPQKQPNEQTSPCVVGLRSVCWKLFLLFDSTELSAWPSSLAASRTAYVSLKEHFLKYIERPEELGSTLDPLDDDQNSPWNALRRDEELRAEILQDVERCMPEEPFFRQPETQHILLNILFIFCKLNQDVGYRQGMHELLAPILWVVEEDALRSEEPISTDTDEFMMDVLNASFIEHDAFSLFSLIMQSAKAFYETGEIDAKTNDQGNQREDQHGSSPIVERSKRIHEVYLARVDPELASHLTELEVLPQIFLIRWIRLLFGREFPFDDLLMLWDVIFAKDPELDLVDLICVSMLLRIRWQLIESNYSMALTLLLKYPAPEPQHGAFTFLNDALFLKLHLNETGGAELIARYSGKRPSHGKGPQSEILCTNELSPEPKLSRRRSPLPSPVRFLQQQGGVEGILQGAAKGVMERSERLGINQAVRDAVGEVKKNVQGLSAPGPSRPGQRGSNTLRWSLDEGRSIPSTKKVIASMDHRNKQLALMLEDALADVRQLSTSADSSTTLAKSFDLAIAKMQIVQVYLENSSMPLPPQSEEKLETIQASTNVVVQTLKEQESAPQNSDAMKRSVATISPHESLDQTADALSSTKAPSEAEVAQVTDATRDSTDYSKSTRRPPAPMPTRSTLAQSSFAWMLEQNEPATTTSRTAQRKNATPFLASRRRTSGSNRERAAFLFGDDTEDAEAKTRTLSVSANADEAFDLGNMTGQGHAE